METLAHPVAQSKPENQGNVVSFPEKKKAGFAFTMYPKHFTEYVMRGYLNPREVRLGLAIIEKTIGFNDPRTGGFKKMDWIARSQFADMTGLDPSSISKGLAALVQSRIIHRVMGEDGNLYYGLNFNFDEWAAGRAPTKKRAAVRPAMDKLSPPAEVAKTPLVVDKLPTEPVVLCPAGGDKMSPTIDTPTVQNPTVQTSSQEEKESVAGTWVPDGIDHLTFARAMSEVSRLLKIPVVDGKELLLGSEVSDADRRAGKRQLRLSGKALLAFKWLTWHYDYIRPQHVAPAVDAFCALLRTGDVTLPHLVRMAKLETQYRRPQHQQDGTNFLSLPTWLRDRRFDDADMVDLASNERRYEGLLRMYHDKMKPKQPVTLTLKRARALAVAFEILADQDAWLKYWKHHQEQRYDYHPGFDHFIKAQTIYNVLEKSGF